MTWVVLCRKNLERLEDSGCQVGMEQRGQQTPPPRQPDNASRLLVLMEVVCGGGMWIESTREKGWPHLELLEGVKLRRFTVSDPWFESSKFYNQISNCSILIELYIYNWYSYLECYILYIILTIRGNKSTVGNRSNLSRGDRGQIIIRIQITCNAGWKWVASKGIVFTIRQVVAAVRRDQCIDTGWMDHFDQASRPWRRESKVL